jgi:flagellar motility protein MotE (MotC chaperone)
VRSALLAVLLLAACASNAPRQAAPVREAGELGQCRAELARLQGELAAEIAEQRKLTRASREREAALRRQLEAMKSIERGILERENRLSSDTR